MLTKIVSVKNVGRLRQSGASGGLLKNVLVLGANGFGKTTLCAILRSAQTGEPEHITGRRTLGSTDACEVHLLTSAGNVRFGPSGWTEAIPHILLFDSVFVAQNVHAGDVVELEQKRNLYRVIIGQDGVGLANDDAQLATDSRTKAAEVTAAAKNLQAHLPAGMKLEAFLKLPLDPDIDTKIAEQAKTVEAVRQAEQLKTKAALTELAVPALPANLAVTLARTVDGIAADAELQLAAHVAAHQMTDQGEAWLSEGMPFIADDKCPFCGQELEGLSLITAYKSLFSNAYDTLKTDVAALRANVMANFGDKAAGDLTIQAANNATSLEFWRRYCTIEQEVTAPADMAIATAGLVD